MILFPCFLNYFPNPTTTSPAGQYFFFPETRHN
jgi:hypothetical protein